MKAQTKKQRKPSKWNQYVKKVFEEGRKKNKNYKFSQALKDASRSRSRGMAGGQNEPIVADTPIVNELMDVDEEVVDEVVDNDGDVAMDIDEVDEVDEEDAPVGGKKRKGKKTHRRRKLRGGQPVLDAEVVEEVAEMNGGRRRHKRRTMKRRKSHKRR